MKKYYGAHKYITECTIDSQEVAGADDTAFVIRIHLTFDKVVQAFKSMGEVNDRVEFFEQIAAHLCKCQFEDSKDPIDRRVGEMVNVLESRQITLSKQDQVDITKPPLKNIGSEDGKDVDADLIVLLNFVLPGVLNQMTRMIEVPSALASPEERTEYSESEMDATHRDLGVLVNGQKKSISAGLEYIGMLPPEQLKFGKQDSLSLVWQLGVILYRLAFDDTHPFLSVVNEGMSEEVARVLRSTGFITQTRRNILLIRYKKATGNDLKSHKLQQLLDKVFCERRQRMSLEQFATTIST